MWIQARGVPDWLCLVQEPRGCQPLEGACVGLDHPTCNKKVRITLKSNPTKMVTAHVVDKCPDQC